MGFVLEIVVLLASLYYAKEEYDNQRIGYAMLWASLVGWNLHTILGTL
jgi:hypothetical protein